MEKDLVETYVYRNIEVPVYFDDAGQSFYATIDGNDISFGSFNNNYREDIQYLIDLKLDTIHHFTDYVGASLMWFDNATHRDIKLTYRYRILKVFLVADESQVNVDDLIEQSKAILNKIVDRD